MMIIILAWKNIWRNKKRSFIILTATAVGLAAGLFAVGMMTGIYDSMVDSAINREYGNIQIHTEEYDKDQLFSQSIPKPDIALSKILSHPDVRAAASHSKIEGMASSAATSFGINIIGIIPENEKQITAISKCIIEGKYLEKNIGILIKIHFVDPHDENGLPYEVKFHNIPDGMHNCFNANVRNFNRNEILLFDWSIRKARLALLVMPAL